MYDGTSASLVIDLYPGTVGDSPYDFASIGNDLYFGGRSDVSGWEL